MKQGHAAADLVRRSRPDMARRGLIRCRQGAARSARRTGPAGRCHRHRLSAPEAPIAPARQGCRSCCATRASAGASPQGRAWTRRPAPHRPPPARHRVGQAEAVEESCPLANPLNPAPNPHPPHPPARKRGTAAVSLYPIFAETTHVKERTASLRAMSRRRAHGWTPAADLPPPCPRSRPVPTERSRAAWQGFPRG